MHLPLLHDGGQFADATALLAQHVLGLGGHDDDLSAGGCDADLDAGVAILGQLTGQELVQLSLEDSVGDELRTRRTISRLGLWSEIDNKYFWDIIQQIQCLPGDCNHTNAV